MGGHLFYGNRFTWDETHLHQFEEKVIFVDTVDDARLTFFQFRQFLLHGCYPERVCKSTVLG